jgi:hypothetical protein
VGKYVTLDKASYNPLFKEEIVAATFTSTFIPHRIPRGGLYQKYNNYKMNELHNYNVH